MSEHEDFIAKAEQEQAMAELQELVDKFNADFTDWEELTSHGANFSFTYDPVTGRKMMEISDLAAIDPTKPVTGDPRIEKAGETLKTALDETLEDTLEGVLETAPSHGMLPPGATQDLPAPLEGNWERDRAQSEEARRISENIQNDLKTKVRAGLVHLVSEAISSQDLILLSALGIDGRKKILDLFIEECNGLKRENFQ